MFFFHMLVSTGFAIFMATHILSSFSKKQRNWKFIRLAYNQWHYNNNQNHLFNMDPPLFLMTDFNLHWKASQEACSTSWGIKAHSHSSSNFKLSTESWGVLQTLLSWINHTEKSRVQIRAPWGPFIFADECWPESSFESFWSHVMEWSLVEDSKVHHQSSYVPREAFSFQNVQNVLLAVQFHAWGYINERISPSGCDCCPQHHRQWILVLAYSLAFHWSISSPKSIILVV